MSNDRVLIIAGDYKSVEDVKADLQKLEQLHHKGNSARLALTSYASPVLRAFYLRKSNAFDTTLTEPRRAECS